MNSITINGKVRRLDLDKWTFDIRGGVLDNTCCFHASIHGHDLTHLKRHIKQAFLDEEEVRVECDIPSGAMLRVTRIVSYGGLTFHNGKENT